jgi:hypothetical protein
MSYYPDYGYAYDPVDVTPGSYVPDYSMLPEEYEQPQQIQIEELGPGWDEDDLVINDTYDEDYDYDYDEDQEPETWIPYAPPQPSQAGTGTTHQVIIGSLPQYFPGASDLTSSWCDLFPEECNRRGRPDPLASRANATLESNPDGSVTDGKGLGPLKSLNLGGVGLAVLLLLLVLLGLNVGWSASEPGEESTGDRGKEGGKSKDGKDGKEADKGKSGKDSQDSKDGDKSKKGEADAGKKGVKGKNVESGKGDKNGDDDKGGKRAKEEDGARGDKRAKDGEKGGDAKGGKEGGSSSSDKSRGEVSGENGSPLICACDD